MFHYGLASGLHDLFDRLRRTPVVGVPYFGSGVSAALIRINLRKHLDEISYYLSERETALRLPSG